MPASVTVTVASHSMPDACLPVITTDKDKATNIDNVDILDLNIFADIPMVLENLNFYDELYYHSKEPTPKV